MDVSVFFCLLLSSSVLKCFTGAALDLKSSEKYSLVKVKLPTRGSAVIHVASKTKTPGTESSIQKVALFLEFYTYLFNHLIICVVLLALQQNQRFYPLPGLTTNV